MKIKVPRFLVLSHEKGGKKKIAHWLNTKIELTKEGLYAFAGLDLPEKAEKEEKPSQTSSGAEGEPATMGTPTSPIPTVTTPATQGTGGLY